MSWACGECATKWPEAVPVCVACLQRDLDSARAVVAAQRETLRKIAGNEVHAIAGENGWKAWRAQQFIAQAALDAEGVSEADDTKTQSLYQRPGSLTSPDCHNTNSRDLI